ncbi:hypothetical protein [Opitutus sp. ER46]|uniref:hypothetical protein n=1 Tax=Opitutus sp. ER46 TaxID=2161864 RepID=UPI000D312D3B|nr:hypothetical protein [Opitutus sp. ER46]PTX91610.1 hypothetical protein DB354_17200 [Opitutus sp. ER46]
MRRFLLAAVFIPAALLPGCQSTPARLREHAAEFAALPAATQAAIRRGEVEPGYTPAMVTMALGRATETTVDAAGHPVWFYDRPPLVGPNERVFGGFRQRVVYNPVKRGNEIITEPVDEKAFPHLVPYRLRLTFADDHLTSIERVR